MVRYRRNYIPGGMFFFTVMLGDRRSSALVDHVALLRGAFRKTRNDRPFSVDAIVILPDHLHAIMTLPPGDSDRAGGDGSRAPLPEALLSRASRFHAIIAATIRFGKSAFGNTPFVTIRISNAAWITFISIRSSMDWYRRHPNGPFPRCIDMSALRYCPRTGVATATRIMANSESAESDPGLRFAPSGLPLPIAEP